MAYPQSWTCPACGNTVYNSEQCTICTHIPKGLGKNVKDKIKAKSSNQASSLLKRRIIAFIIDSLIIFGVSLFVIIGFVMMMYQSIGKDFLSVFIAFLVPLSSIPIIMQPVYFIFYEGRYGGQTYGKKLLKLRVTRVDGSDISYGESLIRNLVRIIEAMTLYIVSIVLIMRSPNGQRLGDRIANTIVISTN